MGMDMRTGRTMRKYIVNEFSLNTQNKPHSKGFLFLETYEFVVDFAPWNSRSRNRMARDAASQGQEILTDANSYIKVWGTAKRPL